MQPVILLNLLPKYHSRIYFQYKICCLSYSGTLDAKTRDSQFSVGCKNSAELKEECIPTIIIPKRLSNRLYRKEERNAKVKKQPP